MHTRKAARSVILFLNCIRITGVQLPFILELDVYLWLAVDHDHTRLIVVFLIHQGFLDFLMHKRADLVEVSRGDREVGGAIYWSRLRCNIGSIHAIGFETNTRCQRVMALCTDYI